MHVLHSMRPVALGVLVLLLAYNGMAGTRVAVWPSDPSVASVADLLTTDLSGEPRVSLVERADIDLIVREQGLMAESKSQDLVRLGSLVGAQGVVFLSRDGTDVVAQLVAVEPGVIVGSYTYPLRGKELEWHALLALWVMRELPRMSVARDDALAVSVAGIRSSLTDPASLRMERDLKTLLLSRLAAEPRVFVLDRERMRVLAQEKTLDWSVNESFWASGYIVEGSINPAGVTAGTTELVLKVNRTGMPSASYSVAGGSDDWPGLVNEVVEKLMSGPLGQEPSSVWNPRREAEVYFEEAKWAQQWGLLPRMQEALEAAWALGLQSQECGLLRAQSYLLAALPPGGRNDAAYPQEYTPLALPSPIHLQNALLGLDSLEKFLRLFPLQGNVEGTTWIPVAIDGLETASIVLKAIYANKRPAAVETGSRDVSLLRLRCRQMADLIEEAIRRARAESAQHDTTLFNHNYQVDVSSQEWLDNVWLRYGGLWHDDPREAAGRLEAVLRRWAARDNEESRRRLDQAIIERTSQMPWLANWTGMPEETFTRLQIDALRQLVFPEYPRTFLYSAYLELRLVTETEDVVAAARRTMNALSENDGWAYNKLYEFEPPILIFKLLDQKWEPLTVAKNKAKTELAKEFSRALLPTYLANSSRAYPDVLDHLVVPGAFGPSERPVIEKAWRIFAERVKLYPASASRYEKMLGISVTNAPERTPQPVQHELATTPIPDNSRSAALAITQFRMPKVLDSLTERSYPLELVGSHLDGNMLWLEGIYQVEMVGVDPREEHVLLGIAPGEIEETVVHLPGAQLLPEVLAVAQGEVFLQHGDQVQRLRIDGKPHSETLPLRATRDANLWRLDAGIFAFADGSILRCDGTSGKTEILASSRRRPAQNILDDRPPFRVHAMMDGPKGTVRALIDASFYQYDPSLKAWGELGKVKSLGAISCNRSGILCYPASYENAQFTFMDPASARPAVLFRTRDRNGQWQDEDAPRTLPGEFPYTPGMSVGLYGDRMAAFDDQYIWFLDGPYLVDTTHDGGESWSGEYAKVRKLDDRDGLLWRFSRTDGKYAAIPIEYRANGRKPKPWLLATTSMNNRNPKGPYSHLMATAQGLAVWEPDGFWWLPRSDIEAYLLHHPDIVHADFRVPDRRPSPSASLPGHEPVPAGIFAHDRVSRPGAPPARPDRGEIASSTAMSLAWKALAQGQVATLQRILEAEGDPDRRDAKGGTMLMQAARSANPSMVETLVAAGADAKAAGPDGKSVLCCAAEGGSVRVIEMVLEHMGGIQGEPDDGARALRCAVRLGKPEAVRVLLEAGAPISEDAEDPGGGTMQRAILLHSVDTVELLLAHGADANATNGVGRTPLIEAAGALDADARIVELLLAHGADVKARDHFGQSAIVEAVGGGSTAMAKLLLDKGADVNDRDHFKTLLHAAVTGQNPDLVSLLLDRGADPNAIDFMGATPLHDAVTAGKVESVQLLLQANADRSIRDKGGDTPAERAAKLGKQDLLDLFSESK